MHLNCTCNLIAFKGRVGNLSSLVNGLARILLSLLAAALVLVQAGAARELHQHVAHSEACEHHHAMEAEPSDTPQDQEPLPEGAPRHHCTFCTHLPSLHFAASSLCNGLTLIGTAPVVADPAPDLLELTEPIYVRATLPARGPPTCF